VTDEIILFGTASIITVDFRHSEQYAFTISSYALM